MFSLRAIVPLTMMLVLPAIATAQTQSPQLSFGLIGGLNVGTLSGSDFPAPGNRTSFTLGGFARWPITRTWDFQAELDYVGKGVRLTDQFAATHPTLAINLNYLEVPLLFRASTAVNSSFSLFGEAGPALAYMASCNGGEGGTSAGCTNSFGAKAFDAGAVLGAGVEMPIGANALSFGARYNYGLFNAIAGSNAKNRNLQFLMGIRF